MPSSIDGVSYLPHAEDVPSGIPAEHVGELGFRQALGHPDQHEAPDDTQPPVPLETGWNNLPPELQGKVALRVPPASKPVRREGSNEQPSRDEQLGKGQHQG